MRLSQNFELYEFLKSQKAARFGFDMTPNAEVIENLQSLCHVVLQPLRAKVGRIDISSGYRPRALNKAVGGSKTSDHLLGKASDITSPRFKPHELFLKAIEVLPVYDQLILEFGQWVHVSYRPDKPNRKQVLISSLDENGKTVYAAYNPANEL